MKTEEFDEAIRKKLESVNQTYTEADIGKVFSHVQRHKGFLPRGFTGTNLLYSLLAAAFIGLIVWNVIQTKENRLIETKIDSLQKNLKQVAAQIEPAPYDSSEHGATPVTAWPDQPVASPRETPDADSPVAVEEPASTSPVSQQPTDVATITVTPEPDLPQSTERVPTTFATLVPLMAAPVEAKARMAETTLYPRQVPQLAIITDSKSASDKKSPVQQVKRKTEPTLAVADKSSKPSKVRHERIAKPTRKRAEKKGNTAGWLTSSEWRAGFQIEATNHQKAIGITGEWVINNRWSLISGLRYSALNAEHFDDHNDYFRDRGRVDDPFLIKPHELGDQPRNIDLDNKLLQVPLAVRFYIPLKPNVTSLFITAGTNFDIVLFQRAQYDRPTDSLLHVHEDIRTTTTPDVFNNLFLGAGVQYNRRKWAFQAGLVLSQSLLNTPYKPSGLEYGVNATMMYRFNQ